MIIVLLYIAIEILVLGWLLFGYLERILKMLGEKK